MSTALRYHIPFVALLTLVANTGVGRAQSQQYVSTVQIAVQETSPELTQRSQNIAMEALANVFDSWPELAGKRYEIKKVGNEIVSYLISSDDMQVPMQRAVSTMFARLSWKTHARGRYLFYRTTPSQPVGTYRVIGDGQHGIRAISAQSVPLRDLLKDIKTQIGTLSYLMPGDCAERLVDWNFGAGDDAPPKSIDGAMAELATLMNLKMVKQNGTFIFNGNCRDSSRPRAFTSADLFHSGVLPGNQGYQATQVYFPIVPLGNY